MRWLYHIKRADAPLEEPYSPPRFAQDGFVHCSFSAKLKESAAIYYPGETELQILRIDPLRLNVPVEIARTPRGPMPHIMGPVPLDAVRASEPLEGWAGPDQVTGLKIAVVAFAGMTLLDLVGVFDSLRRIRSMGIDPSTSVELISATEAPWRASGASLAVDRIRPDLQEFDLVVLPGGPEAGALTADESVLRWLNTYPSNRLIASVCTGALLLGAMGRLQGLRATTHRSAVDSLRYYGATPSEARVVDEGQVVTAGGVTSAIDLGLHLVERLFGQSAEVAARIEYPPDGGEEAAPKEVELFRPVGPEELAKIKASGFSRFPERLPEQPIFYPVLNQRYAEEIAQRWNVPESGEGFVTRFKVQRAFLERYEVQVVGAAYHQEYWIPAEALDAFNEAIEGSIEVVRRFSR